MAEEKNNKTTDHGKILASWKFPEFIKYKKTKGWYIGTIIIICALAIFAIFTQSYLFLLIIIIFITIYIIRGRREPMLLDIEITEDGIKLEQNSFYEWKEIKNFWIIYEPPEVKNLYFDFKVGLRPSVSIFMKNQNPLNIRKILLEYLPEDTDKENESFSDGLSRMLKL